MRVDRLKQAKEWALNNPGHFNMNSWVRAEIDAELNPCKTTMCLAGWAASQVVGEEVIVETLKEMIQECGDQVNDVVTVGTVSGGTVENIAREWFELDPYQANRLFYSQNDWLGVINDLIAEGEEE